MDHLERGLSMDLHLRQTNGQVNNILIITHINLILIQLPISFVTIDWCFFWLIAKDVLRLRIFRDFVSRTGLMEKNELPVESLIKLTLFTGNSSGQRMH